MIIVRSPLRITLGGGGTDVPSYYEKYGGFCIAAAIDKYVYITLHETFVDDLIIKYSKLERVTSADQVEHPIFREALALTKITGRGLELSSMADIPAGTGLGSSSSFTTALLKALYTYKRETIQPSNLAHDACYIEIHKLGEPIGKQDQYISAYGGLTTLTFPNPFDIEIERLEIAENTMVELEENLLLFFTGYSRSASAMLRNQNKDIESLHTTKALGLATKRALIAGNLDEFAQLLTEQWYVKRYRSEPTPEITDWCNLGLSNGALGGKLVGAGGGGFLLFYAEDRSRLRVAMRTAGLREVRFRFDFSGTTVLNQ